MITVVPASPAHVGTIAARMREADRIEVAAMGRTPKQALRLGLQCPGEAWTAKVDGVPEAMFGLHVVSALGRVAHPWMLGSDAIYRYPRMMLRHGKRVVDRWLDSTNLSNFVSADNARAIRMLRRWGFEIGKEVIPFAGVEFLTFTMER